MQQNLLQIVQTILSALDSDEVNSIDDTVESMQVATLLRQLYYDIAVDLDLKEHEGMIEINASGDPAKPVLMTIPSDVSDVKWVKYDSKEDGDTAPLYKDIQFMEFNDFITMTQSLREEANTGVMTITIGTETFEIVYRNDKHPSYFTTLDGTTLIFDSYDSSLDSTLVKNKSMVFGNRYPSFLLTNTFTPDLDPTQFSYFINKAKVRAFFELKQQQNPEAIGETRRQKIVQQVRKYRTQGLTSFERAPKYGRKS